MTARSQPLLLLACRCLGCAGKERRQLGTHPDQQPGLHRQPGRLRRLSARSRPTAPNGSPAFRISARCRQAPGDHDHWPGRGAGSPSGLRPACQIHGHRRSHRRRASARGPDSDDEERPKAWLVSGGEAQHTGTFRRHSTKGPVDLFGGKAGNLVGWGRWGMRARGCSRSAPRAGLGRAST
jgi:hypothetical protein